VRSRGTGVTWALLAMLSSTGCSLLFVTGPPPPEMNVPYWQVECTNSYTLPVIDVLWTSLGLLTTGIAISRSDADYRGSFQTRNQAIASGFGSILLYGISSGVGFSRVSACNDAMAGAPRAPRRPTRRGDDRLPYFRMNDGQRAPDGEVPEQPPQPAPPAPAPVRVAPPAPAPVAPAPPTPAGPPVRQQTDVE
jgi:hypothetical protein